MTVETQVNKLALSFMHEWREANPMNRIHLVRNVYQLQGIERRAALTALRMLEKAGER